MTAFGARPLAVLTVGLAFARHAGAQEQPAKLQEQPAKAPEQPVKPPEKPTASPPVPDLQAGDKAAAKEHYEKGRAAYEKGQFEDAIKELKQAYMLSRRAAILFNIGQTYKQLGDAPLALHFFQKFLAEADVDDPNRSIAQAAIESLQAEAAKNGQTLAPPAEAGEAEAAGEGGATEGEAAPPPVKAPDFRHVPVGEAPPGRPVDVRIRVGDDAQGYPSFLYYRGAGEEIFTKVRLTEGPHGLTARIPKKAMSSGKSIQYYVETRTPDGGVYGSSGTAANPNVIVIDPHAKPKLFADLGAVDEALAARPPAYTRYYRPAKLATAGAAVVALGLAAGFGAYSARLTTDIEKRARASSIKNPDTGQWSYPQQEYTRDLENLDQRGRAMNFWATTFGITAVAIGAASGVLFYLDARRAAAEREASEDEGDVSLAPLVGPGFGGAVSTFRF